MTMVFLMVFWLCQAAHPVRVWGMEKAHKMVIQRKLQSAEMMELHSETPSAQNWAVPSVEMMDHSTVSMMDHSMVSMMDI